LYSEVKNNAEAKRVVRVARRLGLVIVLESAKTIANLVGRGKMTRWAKVYFHDRVKSLSEEHSVPVWEVNPAWTSCTCPHCGFVWRESRDGESFWCLKCGFHGHADHVGALNISERGRASILRWVRSGARKNNRAKRSAVTKTAA
jgi:transposase